MSDTPETDKAERMAFSNEYMVPTEFARELERQRDETRDELCHLRACVFDALSALEAGAFDELKKAWEEGAK